MVLLAIVFGVSPYSPCALLAGIIRSWMFIRYAAAVCVSPEPDYGGAFMAAPEIALGLMWPRDWITHSNVISLKIVDILIARFQDENAPEAADRELRPIGWWMVIDRDTAKVVQSLTMYEDLLQTAVESAEDTTLLVRAEGLFSGMFRQLSDGGEAVVLEGVVLLLVFGIVIVIDDTTMVGVQKFWMLRSELLTALEDDQVLLARRELDQDRLLVGRELVQFEKEAKAQTLIARSGKDEDRTSFVASEMGEAPRLFWAAPSACARRCRTSRGRSARRSRACSRRCASAT